jgi:hypothetical protein
MSVLSLVTARISPERRHEVIGPYEQMVGAGLPDAIRETFLLVDLDDDQMAIATIWRSREDLETVRASSEEPFARRVLREAGGEPLAQFFEIVAEAPRSTA